MFSGKQVLKQRTACHTKSPGSLIRLLKIISSRAFKSPKERHATPTNTLYEVFSSQSPRSSIQNVQHSHYIEN